MAKKQPPAPIEPIEPEVSEVEPHNAAEPDSEHVEPDPDEFDARIGDLVFYNSLGKQVPALVTATSDTDSSVASPRIALMVFFRHGPQDREADQGEGDGYWTQVRH